MRFVVCLLIAFPGVAQLRSLVAGKPTDSFTMAGEPHFELYADHPSPLPEIVAGYSSANRRGRLASIGHRYFYDRASHIYFGYDVVLEPLPSVDTYRAAFYGLSIGPLDFQIDSQDSLNPALWRNVPLAVLPPPQVVKAGDPISVNVFGDPEAGRGLVDTMSVIPMPPLPRRFLSDGRQAWQQVHLMSRNGNSAAPPASAIFGGVREFSVDDAEMRIQTARVTINGAEEREAGGSRVVTGPLVWFYAPKHGRYIMSLTPRQDLGFVKAGEIRAGMITFTIGKDEVLLQSPAAIAPGNGAYTIYVLHDPSWTPTAQGQLNALLFGSVSPRELAAVTQK